MLSPLVRAIDRWCTDSSCCNPPGYHFAHPDSQARDGCDRDAYRNETCPKCGNVDNDGAGVYLKSRSAECTDCRYRWFPADIALTVSLETVEIFGLALDARGGSC
jgi:hypothetical protein